MNAIKILIVEDDDLVAEGMGAKLSSIGYEIVGIADSCEKALQLAKTNTPDIVFVDIVITGKKDGIETAKELKAVNPGIIFIFITNLHDDKTLQRALAVNPAGYLHKPFTEGQLHASIQTAIHNAAQTKEPDTAVILDDNLFLKDGNIFKKYNIADILYIEAGQAYCFIHIKGGKKLTRSINMGDTLEKINHPDLVRVHRSYVANIKNIHGIKGNMLLIGDEEIPTSDLYREDVFRRLRMI